MELFRSVSSSLRSYWQERKKIQRHFPLSPLLHQLYGQRKRPPDLQIQTISLISAPFIPNFLSLSPPLPDESFIHFMPFYWAINTCYLNTRPEDPSLPPLALRRWLSTDWWCDFPSSTWLNSDALIGGEWLWLISTHEGKCRTRHGKIVKEKISKKGSESVLLCFALKWKGVTDSPVFSVFPFFLFSVSSIVFCSKFLLSLSASAVSLRHLPPPFYSISA